MDAKAVAWTAYLPLPGLFLLPLYACPGERLARFHAKQGGAVVLAWFVLLALVGFLARGIGPNPIVATLAALVLVGGVAAMVAGLAAALRGKYVRIRPVWDLLTVLSTPARARGKGKRVA